MIMNKSQNDVESYNMSIPDILYKYKSWPKNVKSEFKDILTQRNLYIPSPLKFNDPFDSCIPMLATGTEEEIFDKALEIAQKEHPRYKKESIRKVARSAIQEKHYCNFSEQKKILMDNLKYRYGVCSLTTKNDNLVMWSHYADSHKGVCLGFNVRSLVNKSYFYLNKEIILLCYSVDYYGEYPNLEFRFILDKHNTTISLIDFKEMVKPLLSKSNHWQYEEEYRILSLNMNNYSIEYDPSELISLYLGYRMETEQKEEIVKLMKNKFPRTVIYQSIIKDREFGLEFVQI